MVDSGHSAPYLNIKNFGFHSESKEISGQFYDRKMRICFCIYLLHIFCLLVCIPPLLGNDHSSVSNISLFLQLFVNKRTCRHMITIVKASNIILFTNIKRCQSEVYGAGGPCYRDFAND
jgi:hypothetical protein